ncbi:hypothetical protein K449DRAFT_434680 [Hypoxylon sp. EC38]|nr:hypothetical protein K449DRAFT_434680 [Hypoxylon sp. EC38]
MLDLPLVIKLLVSAIPTPSTTNDNIDYTMHKIWMERIILPILNSSAINHQRWTTLFLKLNGFDFNIKDLPSIPLNPMLLADLFRKYPVHFPPSTFDTIKDVVKINISPGNSIAFINKAVRTSHELLQSNAGKHWLSVWGTRENPLSLGAFQFADLLFDKTMNSSGKALGGATIKTLQNFIIEIAEMHYSMSGVFGLDTVIGELDFPGRINSPETHKFFKLNCIPLLTGLKARIKTPRTVNWQYNPNQQSQQTPVTWLITLQILKGKYWQQDPEILADTDIQEFVRDVTSHIKQLAISEGPCYESWRTLKQAALHQFHKRHFLSLAFEFGLLEKVETPDRSFVDFLRFDLASEFISEAEVREDENPLTVMQLEMLFYYWGIDPNEVIRTRAESLAQMLNNR